MSRCVWEIHLLGLFSDYAGLYNVCGVSIVERVIILVKYHMHVLVFYVFICTQVLLFYDWINEI